jgi:hypothetical protein
MLVMALLAVGCGDPDCDSVCDDKKCDGVDCKATCKELEDVAGKVGCDEKFEDLLSCMDDADDVCADNACDSEFSKLNECYVSYCVDHPTESICDSTAD